ncbi:SUKH-4 family immunity protein [Streptomyces lydicus]|uniref:SUKH-4 family immunity protein n=1 Tax=Streptomyces lydicus TaxID=47763 RepID=UPI0036FE61DD
MAETVKPGLPGTTGATGTTGAMGRPEASGTGGAAAEDAPLVPDAAWLAARFGADALWRPAESELPEELTHAETREFLTTVGFPAVMIGVIGLDTRHLRADDGEALYAFDADELYGNRYPDDDSPPVNFCFSIGTWADQMLMLDAGSGGIDHYDPNGWDHGSGYKGAAAWSLPDLAVHLGLIAARADELGSDDEAVAQAAAAALRTRMRRHDATVDESPFWGMVFEEFEECEEY